MPQLEDIQNSQQIQVKVQGVAPGEFFEGGFSATKTTQQPTNGVMRLIPIVVPDDFTVTSIACETTASGTAGSVTRMGIYADDGNGRPGSLILDAGTTPSTTIGLRSIAISQALTAGLYWIGAVTQGAPATRPTYRAINVQVEQVKMAATPANLNQSRYNYTQTGITSVLPTTASGTIDHTSMAIVALQRSV